MCVCVCVLGLLHVHVGAWSKHGVWYEEERVGEYYDSIRAVLDVELQRRSNGEERRVDRDNDQRPAQRASAARP